MRSKRLLAAISALFVAAALAAGGCSKSNQSQTAATAAPAQVTLPFRNEVSFTFNDVKVTTTGPTLMRLGFTIHNNSKDTVLCDPSEFTIKLSDGTIVAADTSADDTCTPDSLDPGQSGQAVMFFDLSTSYTGPVELAMTGTNAIIGKATTTIK